MDYIKVRKWLRFYEREEVDAVTAVYLIAFYLGRMKEFPVCYEEGVCSDEFTCCPNLCPKINVDECLKQIGVMKKKVEKDEVR